MGLKGYWPKWNGSKLLWAKMGMGRNVYGLKRPTLHTQKHTINMRQKIVKENAANFKVFINEEVVKFNHMAYRTCARLSSGYNLKHVK